MTGVPPLPMDRLLAPAIRLAPAKLNLTLAVGPRRPDGYHDLHSVMVPLALADRLSVGVAAHGVDTLGVTGGDTGPTADNLVLRAIAAAREAVGRAVETPALAARLEKRIPVAAGLAGGSSDAAAAIDAALEAWAVDAAFGPSELAGLRGAVARRLGSDVPFFLAAGPALVTGRGDRVEPLPPIRGTVGVLLVTPAIASATPDVYGAFDAEPAAAPRDPRSTLASSEHLAVELRAGLRADALAARGGVLASANDLAAAADVVVPGLRDLRRALGRRLGRPVGTSGSGPTLWVLYASAAEAVAAAEGVEAAVRDATLVAPGSGRPTVIATTIAGAERPPGIDPGREAGT